MPQDLCVLIECAPCRRPLKCIADCKQGRPLSCKITLRQFRWNDILFTNEAEHNTVFYLCIYNFKCSYFFFHYNSSLPLLIFSPIKLEPHNAGSISNAVSNCIRDLSKMLTCRLIFQWHVILANILLPTCVLLPEYNIHLKDLCIIQQVEWAFRWTHVINETHVIKTTDWVNDKWK